MENKLDTRTCPICGQDNGCMLSQDCWCYDVKVPKGILDMVSDDKKGQACICKSCVEKYKSTL